MDLNPNAIVLLEVRADNGLAAIESSDAFGIGIWTNESFRSRPSGLWGPQKVVMESIRGDIGTNRASQVTRGLSSGLASMTEPGPPQALNPKK